MHRSLLVVLGSLFLFVSIMSAVVSADDKEKPKAEPDKNAPGKNVVDKPEADKLPPPPLTLDKLIAKNKELVPTLIGRLNDPDAQVRQMTAYILANIGRDALPGLIEAMASKDTEVRANAAYVLGALGKLAQDAMPTLVNALKDENADVRQRAAYAIQRILSATPLVEPPPPLPPTPMPPAKEEPKKEQPKKEESKDKSGAAATPGVIRASWSVPVMSLPRDPGLLMPSRFPRPPVDSDLLPPLPGRTN
jgi:hypothetical protein